MNYRHAYHVGNFADAIKHIILTTLIHSLTRKPTPLCYIDTHAGVGLYDLFAESSAKTKEYQNGIEKIIQAPNPPALVRQYLDSVHRINNRLTGAKFASLRYYPGSPMIARCLLRPHDRIIVSELQPQEYQALRTTFAGDKQVSVHHMDGFLGLKAFLPPHERRGLILIDPPYENPDEYNRLAHSLPMALKRFASGVYAIWYPIKGLTQIKQFYHALKTSISQPTLIIELTIYPDLPDHLNGCGLAVINPPWQLAEDLNDVLPWVWKALSINNQGYHRCFMLNNENAKE